MVRGIKVKKIVSIILVISMVMALSLATFAATTIEDIYKVAGSNSVTTTTETGYNNDTLMIYYPTNLDGNYPLITWGNGTWANPTQYSELLTHIASYGFIIVCSYDSDQGTGELMKNAADYMIEENDDPNSMFYNKIDTDNIAAMGHSQGACGAVNVATSASYIDTVIPMSLVSESTLDSLGVSCDVTQITVPTLLTDGENETSIMAPPYVTAGYYYSMITNNIFQPVVKASLTGAGHNEMMNFYGNPERYFGYITAWLLFQLKGDTTARAAFAGNNPEILNNSNWIYVDINNIH